MNVRIARDPSVDDLGGAAPALSEAAMYVVSQIMQLLGISHIGISMYETMSGKSFSVAESGFFPNVPEQVLRWSEGAIPAIGGLMSALSVYPGESESDSGSSEKSESYESDLRSLETMWSDMSSPKDKGTRSIVPPASSEVESVRSIMRDWEASISNGGGTVKKAGNSAPSIPPAAPRTSPSPEVLSL